MPGRQGKKKQKKKKPEREYQFGEKLLRLLEKFLGKEFYQNSLPAAQLMSLYPGREGKKQVRLFYRKKAQKIAVSLLGGVLLTGVIFAMGRKNTSLVEIFRNSYGGSEKVIEMHAENGAEESDITVSVSAKEYTKKEAEEFFDQAEEALPKAILGENDSLAKVDHDLHLVTALSENPVTITWTSGDYMLIESDGDVRFDSFEQDGEKVKLCAVLSLGTYMREITYMAVLYQPVLTDEEAFQKEIVKQVQNSESMSRTKDSVKLPTKVNGKNVTYSKKDEHTAIGVLVFSIILAVVLALLENTHLQKRMKERTQQMEIDYTEILGKFVLLLGAGMTMQGAWRRITSEYERTKKARRFAYEEMCITTHELESGTAEAAAYEHFGKRCASPEYIKFSALLSQNLRKGNKDLLTLFRTESKDAFEKRKNRAKARGEEAGTKLLVPMFLMLAAVLIVVIVPAFMSMRL